MYTDGYIKLSRTILEWGWYKDKNTMRLFLHLLLCANYIDGEFETHKIKRGQLITGRKKLSNTLGMTEREVRTALNHLKTTNEITIKTTSKYSIITIVNYEKYQGATSTSTNKRPTNDQQLTSNQPQYNKDKKYNKYNNARNNVHSHEERNASYTIEDLESKSLFKD